jgi:hypothetical protein
MYPVNELIKVHLYSLKMFVNYSFWAGFILLSRLFTAAILYYFQTVT